MQAGGEADPDAAAAGRKALLASRMNTIFSFTMLMFMVGTSHFFAAGKFKFVPSGSDRGTYWIIAVVIWRAARAQRARRDRRHQARRHELDLRHATRTR